MARAVTIPLAILLLTLSCYRPFSRFSSGGAFWCLGGFGCFVCFCGLDALDLGALSALGSLDGVDFGSLAALSFDWLAGVVDACSLLVLALFDGGVKGLLDAFEPLGVDE